MSFCKRILYRPFFIRLLHWEYWSFNAVYGWILPVWALLALRAKSFFFFSASNPAIENGGFLMESKKKIYDILPTEYYPKTSFFLVGTAAETVLTTVHARQYKYPLILKPDVGGQGRGVKKVYNEAALVRYITDSPLNYLVQELATQHQEVGVFYYRYPGEASGKISGVVRKELLTVTGDGFSTIRELLLRDKRFILQLPALEKLYGTDLEQILDKGVQKELVPYGNHARGAKFLDDTHRVDEQFLKSMDAICHQIKGFYFGRLDIRYNTWEELREGKNFSIIEINGAGSEPTHMYDPRHSLFFAWKEIIRHWVILCRISRANHKKGIPYLSYAQGVQLLRDNKAFEKKISSMYD